MLNTSGQGCRQDLSHRSAPVACGWAGADRPIAADAITGLAHAELSPTNRFLTSQFVDAGKFVDTED